MRTLIEKLARREDLSSDEIGEALQSIMGGGVPEGEIRDFLLALNAKGFSVSEITGAAQILRKFSLAVKTRHQVLLDSCGTGGDKKDTFNISTLVALVVAAAGVPVAKHGNRAVSSRCGSADLLEALGVRLDLDEGALGRCLDEVGIAFLFAPRLHPAMKNVAGARKALGVKTIFNVLGPLINPARATHQLMGVYTKDLVQPLAHVLKNLGLKKAVVVHGADGMDEVTTTGPTYVSEFSDGRVVSYETSPVGFGVPLAREDELKGGDLPVNVAIAKDVLAGGNGPKTDIVILNAAFALYAAEKVRTVAEGVTLARQTLNAGQARQKLEQLVAFTKAGG